VRQSKNSMLTFVSPILREGELLSCHAWS
jgi:hypothetical protein